MCTTQNTHVLTPCDFIYVLASISQLSFEILTGLGTCFNEKGLTFSMCFKTRKYKLINASLYFWNLYAGRNVY
jgi:hypothetical protein